MSGSLGHQAPDAPAEPGRGERVMNLTTARKMLPLVQRIVADILDNQRGLDALQPQLDRLDRQKRDLVWLERQRRYALREEQAGREARLGEAQQELRQLGVILVNLEAGRVGFPTMVNNRPAFFAWWPGEEGVTRWHFANESRTRTIPAQWQDEDVSFGTKN